MTTWTDSARQTLEDYLVRLRRTLAASGADPVEVTDDLRRHLDGEIAERRIVLVTAADVRGILHRISPPAMELAAEKLPESGSAPEARKPVRLLLLCLGVILPAITILIEATTHICAGALFDPIPTLWHLLLVSLVPVANLTAWISLRTQHGRWHGRTGALLGFSAGIAIAYALLFLPLTPFAIVGVIYFGIGFLPLAPLLGAVATFGFYRHLKRLSLKSPRRHWRCGAAVSALALALVVAPGPATRQLARAAVSENPAARSRGIFWLRLVGDEDVLLRDCYGNSRFANAPVLLGEPLPVDRAREVYFRVTGRPFNTVAPPQRKSLRGANVFEEFTWDAELGGETVAGRLKYLSLLNSRIDAIVEAGPALGYLEWVLEFRNDSRQAQEARAQIALPPGGVVSRLTLWVNGEEREAAFAGRSQVRDAYQKVAVVQRRDPVLVTSCGPDRVMMQCFPVPADGGTMKVRLGVTMPLIVDDLEHPAMIWPHFLERNFNLADDFQHSIWAQSMDPLRSGASILRAQRTSSNHFSLHGDVSDRALTTPGTVLRVHRDPHFGDAWTLLAAEPGSPVIRQTISAQPSTSVGRIVIVVDGSASMGESISEISRAVAATPDSVELFVLVAGDEVRELGGLPDAPRGVPSELARELGRLRFEGGQNNIPALIRGWEIAAESANGIVIWVHGPQPMLLQPLTALKQKLEWRHRWPRLYDLQMGTGPNRVAEELDGMNPVRAVPRLGTLEQDLTRLIMASSGKAVTFEVSREQGTISASLPKASECSKHLARLWAAEEVRRLKFAHKIPEAIKLAATFQLVTAVSGAVVLETAQQFEQAGLEPVDVNSVPTVPEPGTVALLLIGCGSLLLWRGRMQRRSRSRSMN